MFLGPHGLFQEHVDAWAEAWDQGKVEVKGESAVQKAVEFSQYYLMTAMSPIVPQTVRHMLFTKYYKKSFLPFV